MLFVGAEHAFADTRETLFLFSDLFQPIPWYSRSPPIPRNSSLGCVKGCRESAVVETPHSVAKSCPQYFGAKQYVSVNKVMGFQPV